MEKKCQRCGSEKLQPGTIQSTGKIYFRPEDTKFVTYKTADIEVKSNICIECGNIELAADTQRVLSLIDKTKTDKKCEQLIAPG